MFSYSYWLLWIYSPYREFTGVYQTNLCKSIIFVTLSRGSGEAAVHFRWTSKQACTSSSEPQPPAPGADIRPLQAQLAPFLMGSDLRIYSFLPPGVHLSWPRICIILFSLQQVIRELIAYGFLYGIQMPYPCETSSRWPKRSLKLLLPIPRLSYYDHRI